MSELVAADCREYLRALPDACADSCVTDPPYEIGFMGKGWDRSGIANDPAVWSEVLRVLKPGGHLLAFSATRTYHRMVCAIEDAGFEIRDQIGWIYGSGFPKNLDVSKAIDKAVGAKRKVVGPNPNARTTPRDSTGWDRPWQTNPDASAQYLSEAATEAAKQWNGWGTALKPAWEPIVVARKPLVGTVAQNVQQHGAGAMNIDGCRIDAKARPARESRSDDSVGVYRDGLNGSRATGETDLGRWPANIIHDGSEEVASGFPETTSGANPTKRSSDKFRNAYGDFEGQKECVANRGTDAGNAARFFKACQFTEDDFSWWKRFHYSAKAGGDERQGNTHATVKPLALMRYLVRLVTRPGGVVVEPFAGSGSTLVAAKQEGCSFLACDIEPSHVAIAQDRLGRELL